MKITKDAFMKKSCTWVEWNFIIEDTYFTTSFYRKPTVSVVCICVFSHCCNRFKINAKKCKS